MKNFIFSVFILLVVSGNAFAQYESEELNEYLSNEFKSLKSTYGLIFLQDLRITTIGYKIGQRRTWDIELISHHTKVFFIGKCTDDDNCPDIDMAVLDEDGELIDHNADDDNSPLIELNDVPAGKYTIQVTEFECLAICTFAVGVYSYL